MFTLDQVLNAHSKVKSGADFPSYIKEIKSLGVTHYETFVLDGHSVFYGEKNHEVAAPAKYPAIEVADHANIETFKAELLAHQQGKTDFKTFIFMCAQTGIEKWEICLNKMTCTYFDKMGNSLLEEQIPQ